MFNYCILMRHDHDVETLEKSANKFFYSPFNQLSLIFDLSHLKILSKSN